jgi:Mn-dependent DtxR family transcriptional regulator
MSLSCPIIPKSIYKTCQQTFKEMVTECVARLGELLERKSITLGELAAAMGVAHPTVIS